MEFGSDNQAGTSQKILDVLASANTGFTHGYGDDQWCTQAEEALAAFFNHPLEAFFVATGTAANSLALAGMLSPWETVLCHHHAHIYLDESTASEFFTGGARIVPITRHAGKLQLHHLENFFATFAQEPPHTPICRALSVTQANEAGQVYTPTELTALCELAHDHELYVHMDGARFANAVAALDCNPAEISWQAGVDVLTLGATKCGALAAEAVIFFNQELAADFAERRKRAGHLVSKGRLFGAQFVGWLDNDHWLELAHHANSMAQHLEHELQNYTEITIQWPRQANELFITLPRKLATELQKQGARFYEWPLLTLPETTELRDDECFVRLVTSFLTTSEHISTFCKIIDSQCR
jgi:threonine aldolase